MMEYYDITKKETGLHFEGFPDAVKVIQLDSKNSKQSRQLADMALHKTDLDFAAECLTSINLTPGQSLIRQALWRSAIVHFIKCFDSNKGRPCTLQMRNIYKDDSRGKEVFEYFKTIRNKHIIHDENSYAQCIPGAILNKEHQAPKIEKIVFFAAFAETLNQGNFNNLSLLITKAMEWVITKFDQLCDDLTKELEARSYEDLSKMPVMVYSKPKFEDIKKNRNKP